MRMKNMSPRVAFEQALKVSAVKFDINEVERIKRMTARNHHMEALFLGAQMLGNTVLIKKIKHVLELHKLEGEMPKGLSEYRNKLIDDMMKYAKAMLDEDEFKSFYSAF
jgi:hypothetical protein